MHTPLGLEVSVGVGTVDFEGGRGDPGFIRFLIVGDGDFEIPVFGPTGIHAVEHTGPVAGLGATGSGLNGDVGVVRVGRGIEESLEFEGSQLVGDAVEGPAGFAGGIEVIELFGELDPGEEVLEVPFQLEKGVEASFAESGFGKDLAGGILLVPEGRIGSQLLEFLDS